MFNVYLLWNPDYIIKIFKSSLFDITSYKYEFLENSHFILNIKYTPATSGLKINPIMVDHPRYKNGRCMALFFIEDDSMNELIIDTRTTDYCDFIDYIRPLNNLICHDLIQRQEKYWCWLQYFNKYVVDFYIKEEENTYLISLTHGADVEILYDNQFNITKFNYRWVELMAYVKEYEIPKMENINVIYNIL